MQLIDPLGLVAYLGPVAYPLFLVLFLTLVQIARCTMEVLGYDDSGSQLRIHSVLVLGALGSCVGLLGSLIGVQEVADAVAMHGDQVDGMTILSGVGITLGSSIFGFLILGIAAVAWLALQWGAGRTSRPEAQMYTERDIL